MLWRREGGGDTSFGFWAILAAVSAFTAWSIPFGALASYGDLDQALSSSFGWLFFVTAIVSPLLSR
ncbi:MAG: hypothetical protein R3F20_04005 [Planctomycetota bacterium]